MKTKLLIFCLSISLTAIISCQDETPSSPVIHFHINENVKNSDEAYFKEIQQNWESYLNSNNYVRSDNAHWDHNIYPYPDYSYISLLLDIRHKLQSKKNIQCSTIGIVPLENEYYLLKMVFTEPNDDNEAFVDIKFIISVYAKKEGTKYKFYSSTAYHRTVLENIAVGNINYIIHPDHNFSLDDAKKMNEFNHQLAETFNEPPLSFDYIVANNTRDLSELTGVHLFSYSYQAVASGGMADNYNKVIYAGNNSAYYPHEVVHLYTYAKYSRQYHRWFDEGIAALLGGSTGYKIEWHWEKLRRFLNENPDYPIEDLTSLETDVPNGEYMTDFRYAIGALICQGIIDKDGMQGIFEALQAGRSDEDYFSFLEDKLHIERADFGKYVKEQVALIPAIEDAKLDSYKY